MKILYVIPNLEIGGTEKHLYYLASGMRRKGYSVKIVCLEKLGELGKIMEREGFDVNALKINKSYNPLIVLKLGRILKEFKPDVLHTYLFGFHLWAGVAGKFLKVPLIISSRRQIPIWRKWYHKIFTDIGNLFTDYIICCSRAVKEFVIEKEMVWNKKVKVIYNGILFPKVKIENKPEKLRCIGVVANFNEEKGHIYLIKATKLLIKEFPDIEVRLAGKGKLEGFIKEKVKEYGLEKNIFFEGQIEDVFAFLDKIDIFVLPSISEGLPNAVIEALYMEKPVVATKVGGISEVIISGKNGILVRPKNPEELADAIKFLIKNPEFAIMIGKEGRKTVSEKFSYERMVEEYSAVYNMR